MELQEKKILDYLREHEAEILAIDELIPRIALVAATLTRI